MGGEVSSTVWPKRRGGDMNLLSSFRERERIKREEEEGLEVPKEGL